MWSIYFLITENMVKKKQLALQKATLKNENDENSNKLNYVPNEFDNVCKRKGKQVDGGDALIVRLLLPEILL